MLSTLIVIKGLIENRKSIYLNLKLNHILPNDFLKDRFKFELLLVCTNKSKSPFQINSVGIETDPSLKIVTIHKEAVPVGFPIYLNHNQGETIPFVMENVVLGLKNATIELHGKKSIDDLKKIRAFVTDSFDQEIYSNWIDFDLKHLLVFFSDEETKQK